MTLLHAHVTFSVKARGVLLGTTSVSYTHLDVYKRQVCVCVQRILFGNSGSVLLRHLPKSPYLLLTICLLTVQSSSSRILKAYGFQHVLSPFYKRSFLCGIETIVQPC